MQIYLSLNLVLNEYQQQLCHWSKFSFHTSLKKRQSQIKRTPVQKCYVILLV